MNCDTIFTLISEKLDGVISESEDQLLQKHLKSCSLCRDVFEQMQANDSAFSSASLVPPERIRVNVMKQVNSDIKRRRRRIWNFAASGVAAAAVLAIAISLPRFLPSENQKAKMIESTQDALLACEISAPEPTDSAYSPETELSPETAYSLFAPEAEIPLEAAGSTYASKGAICGDVLEDKSQTASPSVLFVRRSEWNQLTLMRSLPLEEACSYLSGDALVYYTNLGEEQVSAYYCTGTPTAALTNSPSAVLFQGEDAAAGCILFLIEDQ